jgi:hypothetical protein
VILLLAGCGGEAFSSDGAALEREPDGGEWLGATETGGAGGEEKAEAGSAGAAGTMAGSSAGTGGSSAGTGGSSAGTGGSSAGTGGSPSTGGQDAGGAVLPACADGEKRCADSDDPIIERCDRGLWVPHTLCTMAPYECSEGRCTSCSTDGVKSEVQWAQCVDGIWSGCVGGDGFPPPTFDEACTEIAVTRWVDGAWSTVWISAIPTP